MHLLRLTLIYTAFALGMVMLWALGYQSQTDAELARAQHVGVPAETRAAKARAATQESPVDAEPPATCPAAEAQCPAFAIP